MAQKAPIEKLEELADGFQALRRRFKSYHEDDLATFCRDQARECEDRIDAYHERLSQKITHGE